MAKAKQKMPAEVLERLRAAGEKNRGRTSIKGYDIYGWMAALDHVSDWRGEAVNAERLLTRCNILRDWQAVRYSKAGHGGITESVIGDAGPAGLRLACFYLSVDHVSGGEKDGAHRMPEQPGYPGDRVGWVRVKGLPDDKVRALNTAIPPRWVKALTYKGPKVGLLWVKRPVYPADKVAVLFQLLMPFTPPPASPPVCSPDSVYYPVGEHLPLDGGGLTPSPERVWNGAKFVHACRTYLIGYTDPAMATEEVPADWDGGGYESKH